MVCSFLFFHKWLLLVLNIFVGGICAGCKIKFEKNPQEYSIFFPQYKKHLNGVVDFLYPRYLKNRKSEIDEGDVPLGTPAQSTERLSRGVSDRQIPNLAPRKGK